MSAPAQVVGVVGAGTMGAGIAQLAVTYGARCVLFDVDRAAAERGHASLSKGLAKLAEKGRLDGDPAEAAARATITTDLADLAPCDLIIEAAPERLELKQDLFRQLSELAPGAVLASNTSSIPITAIAQGAAEPARVVGMHFFNPPPLMKLLEVIPGMDSSEEAVALATATGEAMGRHVVPAADVTGFLVNRCNRPFQLEAMRCVESRLTDVETLDAIFRAAGFRMGPFELQDLVGIDTNLQVAKSFFELSFGEPRWQPSAMQATVVAGGRLGRKTGRGWYAYADGVPHRPEDPAPPEPGDGDGRLVVIVGDLAVAHELRALAEDCGWEVAEEPDGDVPYLCIDAGHTVGDGEPLQGAPQLLLCADSSLHTLDPGGSSAGFHLLPPLAPGAPVELMAGAATSDVATHRSRKFFESLGLRTFDVGDAPGGVLGRVVCQIVNECAFSLGDGHVASPDDVDAGMTLALNHPHGACAWADEIGLDHVLMVLDGLRAETGEERYRAAPLLRRMVSEGRLGIGTGEGFHVHADPDD